MSLICLGKINLLIVSTGFRNIHSPFGPADSPLLSPGWFCPLCSLAHLWQSSMLLGSGSCF